MRVLITGVNGFFGKAITEEYLDRGDVEVVGIAREKGGLPIRYHLADVLDSEAVADAFRGQPFDVVVHLAALTAHSQIVDNKYEALDINMSGTRNLLAAFNQHCPEGLFVYASSGKVYGETDEMPITERAVTNPTNVLGKSKLIAERLIDFYAQPGHKYLIARIFNIYGGDQKDNFVVPTIVRQLKEGNILMMGNLTDQRDYLYIKDFIKAMVGCIGHRDRLGQFEVVNIGSGVPISVRDIIGAFEGSLGIHIDVRQDAAKFRNDETLQEYCDNSRLRELADWVPQYTLASAIDEICREEGLK